MSPDRHLDTPRRLLIVMPNWVGDLVLATPALRAVREQFADAHLAVLSKRAFSDILDGCPWYDEVLHWPIGKTRGQRRQSFFRLAQHLRDKQFDTAVLFTNSFRSALLALLAGIRRRVGYDRDGRGIMLTDKLLPDRENGKYVPVPMLRYYGAIARYLGVRELPTRLELFTTPDEEARADAAAKRFGVAPDQPIVMVNPGATFGAAKCWLPERFAEVADGLIEVSDAAVFIACGPKERDVARAVAAAMRNRACVLDDPILPLGALKALIRRARLLVTNDTGPRHFGIAFGIPVVTVFGSTDPEWTETHYPLERQVMVKVYCGPCMKRVCPLDHRCMTRITASMVLDVARPLLMEPQASVSTR